MAGHVNVFFDFARMGLYYWRPRAMSLTMSSTPSDLADLRRRIDAIDDRLHDLLVERAEIVARVATSKRGALGGNGGDAAFYQPAREAQILRRLAGRHRGILPFAPVVRIWRELLAATVRLETPFSVVVFVPAGAESLWDLARDHYGSQTPLSPYGSQRQVIRAVAEGRSTVGILPLPREREAEPWWPELLSEDEEAPRVIGRLPFGARGNARGEAEALAIGRAAPQQSGADRTLLAIEAAPGVDRARFRGALAESGLACTYFAACERGAVAVNLLELDGFVPLADPRLTCLRRRLGAALHRLLPVGGYALPLPAAALSPGAAEG